MSRFSRIASTVAAVSVAATIAAAPASAQAISTTAYTVNNNSTGCEVTQQDGQRYVNCSTITAEMVDIPGSDGLRGTPAVAIENGHARMDYRTQGWGSQVDPLSPGQFRYDQGLLMIADFHNGMHVFDGFRYVAYVGNGKAIANPGLADLSSVYLSSF